MFSIFDSVDEEANVAVYKKGPEGYMGTVQIKEVTSVEKSEVRILDWDGDAKRFVAEVIVQSCDPTAIEPSDIPSISPSILPSMLASNIPSLTPSTSPILPIVCSIQLVIGRTLYFTAAGGCWKLELFGDGALVADFTGSSTCSKEDFTSSGVFSIFDSVDEEANVAVYKKGPEGYMGTVQIKEVTSVEKSEVRILDWDGDAKRFVAEVIVQSCDSTL